ncbi:MAG TPA: hypothetical protein PKA00_00105 [Saprospiraceae bacterium]|nr:hypothetical protein [Saprospiraceae bacterium]HMQ81265.1 hypothetical protein [Saprospiraceae bacterium]
MRIPSWILVTLALVFHGIVILDISSCQHEPFEDDMVIDTTGNGNPIDTTDNPIDTTTTGDPCNPNIIYFNQQILPILASNCALSGCHDAITHEDGVELTSYEKVMQTAKVRPGDLDDSDLYEVITEQDAEDVMPPAPNARLSPDQIQLIADWILQGAQNLECDPNSGGCATENRSYSAHVQPVIQNHCQGCHSGAAPSAGIDLSTYTGVKGVATDGRLYGVIAPLSGYVPMPYNSTPLNDCIVEQIKSWIDAGAPEN